MGQYYKAVILADKRSNISNKKKVIGYLKPSDYGSGTKLMEQLRISNDFVNAFEELINKENGKYAGYPVIWAGDYADKEPYTFNKKKVNIYSLCNDTNRLYNTKKRHYRYIINEDTKEFFDSERLNSSNGYVINPLPLLIADGNLQGCGDYYGKECDKVGIWKRNVVVVSNNKPDETYNEIFIDWSFY